MSDETDEIASPILSQENVEAELSYAYVHAVAARAAIECVVSGRHSDSDGVDARLTSCGPFSAGHLTRDAAIDVQLKATKKRPAVVDGAFAFPLPIGQYQRLSCSRGVTPRILVVLFLPQDSSRWLTQTEEALSLRHCAYWVSLLGAAPSTNESSRTVYLPTSQKFDPDGLMALMDRIAHRDLPLYQKGAA